MLVYQRVSVNKRQFAKIMPLGQIGLWQWFDHAQQLIPEVYHDGMALVQNEAIIIHTRYSWDHTWCSGCLGRGSVECVVYRALLTPQQPNTLDSVLRYGSMGYKGVTQRPFHPLWPWFVWCRLEHTADSGLGQWATDPKIDTVQSTNCCCLHSEFSLSNLLHKEDVMSLNLRRYIGEDRNVWDGLKPSFSHMFDQSGNPFKPPFHEPCFVNSGERVSSAMIPVVGNRQFQPLTTSNVSNGFSRTYL